MDHLCLCINPYGGHKSIYDNVIFQNIPFTRLVVKLKQRNFAMFKIPKFSRYIVFEVAKTNGTWEYSHVEICTYARFKRC